MGKIKKQSSIYIRDVCVVCGVYPQARKDVRNNKKTYRAMCDGCYRKPYVRSKKNRCEVCDFSPVHRCQLDVHHKDLDHDNNDENNLLTVCANCHRLIHINKT